MKTYCVPLPVQSRNFSNHERAPGIYKTAATPAATAPRTIIPLERTFALAAPVDDALAPDAVALVIDEPEPLVLLELPESSVAAPKIPP